MKRSQINRYMKQAIGLLRKHRFHLPPFAFWSPADWQCKGAESREMRRLVSRMAAGARRDRGRYARCGFRRPNPCDSRSSG